MGGSLLAFLNAKLKPGIQLMLETLDFSNKIKGADLIITGEGKADKQTLMGKVPSGILDKARKQKIPVILIAGSVEKCRRPASGGISGSIFYQSTIHNVGAGHATGSCTRKYLRNGGRDLSFLLKFIFQWSPDYSLRITLRQRFTSRSVSPGCCFVPPFSMAEMTLNPLHFRISFSAFTTPLTD